MQEQLLHILDQSVCLSRKQMRDYLSGAMSSEETHAAEVHLSSCPLCHMALEGFDTHSEEALQAIASLNSGFLKEHFDNISPQIHLNSMAPAAALSTKPTERKRSVAPFWRMTAAAAGLLLLFGLVWAIGHRQPAEVVPPSFRTPPQQAKATESLPVHHAPVQEPPAVSPAPPAAPAPLMQEEARTPTPVSPKTESPKTNAIPHSTAAARESQKEAGQPQNAGASHYDQEYENQGNPGGQETLSSGSATPSSSPTAGHSESYSKESIEQALSTYLTGSKSSDPHTRYQSLIFAAQCYNALGQRDKAEELLRKVIDEAPGPERRAARRALRRLP